MQFFCCEVLSPYFRHLSPNRIINLKKRILVFVVLFVGLCSFLFFNNLLNFPKKQQKKTTELLVINSIKKPVDLKYFPKVKTEKVSKKLDALLSQINKRNDFHGSLLVA